PVMAVAKAALPLPVVCKVKVTVWLLVAPPSVTSAVPDKEIGRASCRDRFTEPLPAAHSAARLVVAVSKELNDSGPSTNWSSTAVTVIAVVALSVAQLAKEAVLAV